MPGASDYYVKKPGVGTHLRGCDPELESLQMQLHQAVGLEDGLLVFLRCTLMPLPHCSKLSSELRRRCAWETLELTKAPGRLGP